MLFRKSSTNTYKDKRLCLHCGSPIPDHISKLRKFCPAYTLPDGKKVNCKDSFHSPRKKKHNEPYKRIADFHKKTHQNIYSLWKVKGSDVTKEDLNQYGIWVNRCVEWKSHANESWTFYFIEFAIELSPDKNYKITKHGRIF